MNNSNPSGAQGASSFKELGVSDALCHQLERAGYRQPTPIQVQAIPHLLEGKDLIGCAQTGTGKTAAFALPILQNMSRHGHGRSRLPIQALILAPTRELASQIDASFKKYAGHRGPTSHAIFGGVGKGPQIKALRQGVSILVATPGRLLDLMGDGEVDLRQIHTFVLDEADRMLDMGFIHDVRRIERALPQKRQTLLFSATMPKAIRDLADRFQKNPVHVAADPVSSVREPIAQSVYFVAKENKRPLLLELLQGEVSGRALVFTRTKHGANTVTKNLVRAGLGAAAIHSNKSQAARTRALEDFKAGRTRIIVATDIAARGIDIKSLPHVINFDLPNEPETYVHRIGRTGRAGESGHAISFCSNDERAYLKSIERLTRQALAIQGSIGNATPGAPTRSTQPHRGSLASSHANRAERTGRASARRRRSPPR